MSGLVIGPDDLSRAAVQALLSEHLEDMYATSPPESVHALDLDALRAPDISFYSAWDGETLLGCGALRDLGDGHLEIKSMRAARDQRGRGTGAAILRHLLDEAVRRGGVRISLETGVEPYFEPARRLYLRHGFVECPPFGDYLPDPNSVFMTRELPAQRRTVPGASGGVQSHWSHGGSGGRRGRSRCTEDRGRDEPCSPRTCPT